MRCFRRSVGVSTRYNDGSMRNHRLNRQRMMPHRLASLTRDRTGQVVTGQPFFRTLAAWTFAGTLLGLHLGSRASGQQAFFRLSVQRSGRMIEAPRSVQQQLREAERSLSQNEESDAVVRLGDLLQRDPQLFGDTDLAGQDFFLDIDAAESTGGIVSDSLLRRARTMIGQLSNSALETYELRYGPMARRMLDGAMESRDWETVREVRRKFFHTRAGYESSFLLAQRELLQGHSLAASLLLDDVVTSSRAVAQLGEAVLQMHAAAMKVAGRRDTIPPSLTDTTLFDQYAESDDFALAEARDYAMFGGGPSRNENSAGQMPLANVRWELETTASPRQEQALRKVASDLATGITKLPPPSWMPLRVGDQLLMRTTERLVGVDYRTGKRIWTWPWFSPVEAFDEEEFSFDSLLGNDGPSDLLSQRVWNDLPYGQISSDGERVFVIDDLGEVEVARYSPMGIRGTRPSDTGTNTLVALDLATEGKLLWRLGAGAEDASSFSNAFFLGPPLPLDGQLYVMIELAGDILLSCLDPMTGNERWRQQLVAVESGGVDVDPIRRVAGASPTFHEGLLICPTGAGAVVTMDLSDRMLRWGLGFERNSEMMRSITGRGTGVEATQLMQRWCSGVAIADRNTLLVTPIESDRLFGIDVLTGQRRFPEKSRVHMRYIAGARDGRFYVVGSNRVSAFDMQSGKLIWTAKDMLAAGQQIVGRGVFGDGDYLLPTSTNELIRISLADGKVLQRRMTNYALGNLVAVDGQIIVQGVSRISVSYGEASIEPLVNEMLKKNPRDFEALVRKSELLIQRGKRREALELLAIAREMDATNDEVHMLSISAMLGELRENINSDSELVDTLDQLIDLPDERAELLSLRIRSALSNDRYDDAIEQLIGLSALLVNERLSASAADRVVGDVARHCSLDSWLAARVSDVAKNAVSTERESLNERVEVAFQSQLQSSEHLLARVVRHFEALDTVATLRNPLADRYAKSGSMLQLERVALGLQVPNTAGYRSLSDDRLLMLVDAYSRGGLTADLTAVTEELASRNDPQLVSEVKRLTALQEGRQDKPAWAKHATLTWNSQRFQPRRGFALPGRRFALTQPTAGRHFEHWRLISEGMNPLALRDPMGEIRPIPIDGLDPRNDVDKEAKISGSFMVIVMPNELVGVNLFNLLSGDGESVVWRYRPTGEGGPVAKRRSAPTPFGDQVYRYCNSTDSLSSVTPEFRLGPVMGDRVLVLQGGDLLAIDLETKRPLWRNSTAPRAGVVLTNGERVAVVSPAIKEVVFFDVLDGRKLETSPWEHGKVWSSVGANVLCWKEQETAGRYDIRLINPFSGEVLLQCESDSMNRGNTDVPCAYGRVVVGKYLVLLDSEGQATIWDLVAAREIGRPMLPAYPNLQGLHAIVLDGQLVLLPRRRVQRVALPRSAQVQTMDGKNHVMVHGVHSVSLDDGAVRWGEDFKSPWGCTLHQPAATPMLLFTRSRFSTTPGGKKQLDALAMDVRDGRHVNKTIGHPILGTNTVLETRLTVQPMHSRVIAQVGGELLTYHFSEQASQDDETSQGEEESQGEEKSQPGKTGEDGKTEQDQDAVPQ